MGKLPIELKFELLMACGPEILFKLGMANKAWHKLLLIPFQQQKQLAAVVKGDFLSDTSYSRKFQKKLLKHFCIRTVWPEGQYRATKSYLSKYTGWLDMLRRRPKLRFDGVYICKMKYYKKGEKQGSVYVPIIEVILWKFVRLNRDGSASQLYTNHAPK